MVSRRNTKEEHHAVDLMLFWGIKCVLLLSRFPKVPENMDKYLQPVVEIERRLDQKMGITVAKSGSFHSA